jgi:hypothetical protein
MGSSVQLGKLERVTIRDVWKDEAHDFTPWLANEATISLLSKAVALELEVEQTESSVGEYRADILARIAGTDEKVVIENQFGKTDHTHLGQLLTYAAGVGQGGTGARAVIWLAEHFAEPHRSALDWLNQVTSREIGFFGIEIELWRIGQSLPAPKFNLVSKPNQWQKVVSTQAASLGENDALYLQFWEGFRDYCDKEGTTLRLSSPEPKRWQRSSIGRSGFGIHFAVNTQKKWIRAALSINHRAVHQAFELLDANPQLRNELGPETEFQESGKRARIARYASIDVEDREAWPEAFAWLKRNGEDLKAALQDRVKKLALDQAVPENDAEDAETLEI